MTDSRARILGRIRDSLERTGSMLATEADVYPPPHPHGPFVATDLDVVEQFRAELTGLRAYVHICDGPAEALEQVCALLETVQAQQVLTWAEEELPLPNLLPTLAAMGITSVERQVLATDDRQGRFDLLESVPVCISGVDAAIAESGTMLVVSGAGRPRLASLLPPMHIALLPVERIVRTMPDAFEVLNAHFSASLFQDRSNLTMITGPSRTADIELSLTLGVHGPREVHAIVIR